MEYDKYEITEVEYNKIKAQHLARKTITSEICYVKELNRIYEINHLIKKGVTITESKIVDGKKELVSKKTYIDGKLSSECNYNGELSTEKIYNDSSILRMGMGTVTRYYKNGKLHRMDGPAIDYEDEKYEGYYYINGRWVNNKFFNKMIKNIKNGRIVHILNNYNYKDLITIKVMIEEIGNKNDLEVVDKYLIMRKLEDGSK